MFSTCGHVDGAVFPYVSNDRVFFILKGQMDKDEFVLFHFILEIEGNTFLRNVGRHHPRTQCNSREDRNPHCRLDFFKFSTAQLCFDLVLMKASDTLIRKRVKNEILMGNCVSVLPA